MSAETRNPRVEETAVRHVARALSKVHPDQRHEVLAGLITHAAEGLAVILGPEGASNVLYLVADHMATRPKKGV